MSGRGGYGSEFEEPSSAKDNKRKSSWRNDPISEKVKYAKIDHGASLPARSSYIDEYEKEERKSHFAQFLSLNAYQRHQKLVGDYLRYYGGKPEHFKRNSANDKTDYDVLKEHHRFVWDEDDVTEKDWGKKLAKRYYDKLFKEYCICDLSCYKENKFAMRWRIEKEVVSGKGQFQCGARKCENKDSLLSWEVNFGYVEHGEKKNALVKLRLCPDCSYKLNYHKKHKKAKQRKREKKKKRKVKKKKKRKHSKNTKDGSSSSDSSSESDGSDSEDEKEKEKRDQKPSSSKQDDKEDVDGEDNIWKKPVKEDTEKTREEEFDDYLDDLFM